VKERVFIRQFMRPWLHPFYSTAPIAARVNQYISSTQPRKKSPLRQELEDLANAMSKSTPTPPIPINGRFGPLLPEGEYDLSIPSIPELIDPSIVDGMVVRETFVQSIAQGQNVPA